VRGWWGAGPRMQAPGGPCLVFGWANRVRKPGRKAGPPPHPREAGTGSGGAPRAKEAVRRPPICSRIWTTGSGAPACAMGASPPGWGVGGIMEIEGKQGGGSGGLSEADDWLPTGCWPGNPPPLPGWVALCLGKIPGEEGPSRLMHALLNYMVYIIKKLHRVPELRIPSGIKLHRPWGWWCVVVKVSNHEQKRFNGPKSE